MNFWKMFFASLAGSFIAFFAVALFLLFIFMASLAALGSGGEEEEKIVKDNTVLELTLDAPIIERGLKSEGSLDLSAFGGEGESIGLNNILASIKKAATDDKIDGIYMNLSGVSGGFSAITDIRDELIKFKESGKWTVAYSESYSQGAYYLASAAEKVYLYPEGGMEWNGLNAELMFYKDMLERIGVDIQVLRGPDNKYKSAVEPYIKDKMSDENRAQYQELLGDLWQIMLDDVSTSRNVSIDELNAIADNISLRTAQDAVTNKLVDGLMYGDQIKGLIKSKLSLEEDDEVEYMAFSDYKPSFKDTNDTDDEIAVVYAVGGIESGEGDDATIGSDRIAQALRDARLNENTKAIVFRVNSPGGSALASDVIWRETQLIKEAKIPFIVSMGDYAASGGYYISCLADTIVASDATLTGSIGVFGMLPNAKGLLEDKIGIHTDRVGTNANGNISAFNPLNDTQHAAVTEMITDIYTDFIGKVADGRGMNVNDVDSVAQGRVWSGTDAKTEGLVDVIGNLEAAKQLAAESAGITDYDLAEYPVIKDPFQKFLEDMGIETSVAQVAKELGFEADMVRELNFLLQEKNAFSVQARLPYMLKIY